MLDFLRRFVILSLILIFCGDEMEKELRQYIRNEIKEKYKSFDKGHNISHFNFVTKNCVNYAKKLIEKGYEIDLDIAYIVGAFHDIGISLGREGHALSSGKIVRQDEMLKKYYSSEEIEMIAQAVEDHSSHLGYEPRSIYGKIVADADRNNTCYLVFSRPVKYGLKNEAGLTRQQHIDRVYDFVVAKFGRQGYVKYWLDIEDTKKEQNAVWELLDNEKLCKMYIAGILDECTKNRLK